MSLLADNIFYTSKNEDASDRDFDALFLAHYDRVYGILFRLVGNRVEAENLAQETFIKLHQTPPSKDHTNVGAWLYRVATNLGYNEVRSRKRRWSRDTLLLLEPNERDNPEQQVERGEETAVIRATLAKLSPQQGQLLMLRQMGLSYADLAEACDINPTSVGKTLSRAADAFRQAYLAESGGNKSYG